MDLKTALDVCSPRLLDLVTAAKDQFLATWGSWVDAAHKDELEDIFLTAGKAKIQTLLATTPEETAQWQDVYETTIERIETLGLADSITGRAVATSLIKSSMNLVLGTVAACAGALMSALIAGGLPGLGSFIGPPVGAGVTYVLDDFFGVKK